MNLNHRSFANVVLVAVVVVLVGAAGYFAFFKKAGLIAQPPTLTPTPIGDPETAFWKNYRNDAYGFEIKYPPSWTAKGSWSENGGFFYVAFGVANTIDSEPLARLLIYTNQTTLSRFMKLKYFYLEEGWKDVTLDSVAAREIVSVGQGSRPFIVIASVKNTYGYVLESTVFGDNIDVVRKMSSTFKFLK